MDKELLDALDSCLAAMQAGQTLETALGRFPQLEARLRPLLEVAERTRTLGGSELPVGASSRGRARLLAQAADLRRSTSGPVRRRVAWRTVLASVIAVLALVLGGNGLLMASAHSLPGDPLYAFKRSMEDTQLSLLADPVQRQALQVAFSQRRLDETRSLISIGRVEPVVFDGVVASRTGDGWLVSGIPVVVGSGTRVDSPLEVGDRVSVSGETGADGNVVASHLAPFAAGPTPMRSPHPVETQYATDTPGAGREYDPSRTQQFAFPTSEWDGGRWNGGGGYSNRTPEPTESGGSQEQPGGTTTPEWGGGRDGHH